VPDLDRDHLSDFNRELLEAHDEVVDELLARLEAIGKRSPEDAQAFSRLLDWLDRHGGSDSA
jgi:hypothetical protein